MKNFIITLLLALTGLFVSCSSNNVEQEAITPPASISLSKDKLEFDSNEDYQTVNITASSEWTTPQSPMQSVKASAPPLPR